MRLEYETLLGCHSDVLAKYAMVTLPKQVMTLLVKPINMSLRQINGRKARFF